MGTDALADYQQLGARLDQAAERVRSRRRRASGAEAAHDPGSEVRANPPGPPEHARQADEAVAEAAVEDPKGGEAEPDGVVVAENASAEGPRPDGPPPVDLATLEALIFSSRHPLTPARISELIEVASARALRAAVAELNRQYEAQGRSFRIEMVAGGYQMLTLPAFGPVLQQLHQRDSDAKLSRSALETLAIIAYKQPVLRAEVESIRGVASGETIRGLMEKHLVRIAGRAEEPGRPILYGTTRRFLEVFGLTSLKELPKEESPRLATAPASATAPRLAAVAASASAGAMESSPAAAPVAGTASVPASGSAEALAGEAT